MIILYEDDNNNNLKTSPSTMSNYANDNDTNNNNNNKDDENEINVDFNRHKSYNHTNDQQFNHRQSNEEFEDDFNLKKLKHSSETKLSNDLKNHKSNGFHDDTVQNVCELDVHNETVIKNIDIETNSISNHDPEDFQVAGDQINNIDDDDDFADFESFQISNENHINDMNEIKFEGQMYNQTNDNVDDDFDDFADFTSANLTESVVQDSRQELSLTTKVLTEKGPSFVDDKNDKIDFKNYKQLVADTFPVDKNPLDNEESKISIDFFDENNRDKNSIDLWNNLQQLDLKLNFTFNRSWKQSSSFKHLVESLKIDSRNVIPPDIISKKSMTYNQILQPTVYDHTTAAITAEDNHDKDYLSDQIPMNFFSNHKNHSSSSSTSITEKESIPSSSSNQWPPTLSSNEITVNVNSDVQISNNIIAQDLDFFENKYVNSSSSNNNMVNDYNDLIAEFDDFLTIDNDTASISSTSAADTTNDSKPSRKNNQILSAEALQILNELPNLSMMRAKILLYPSQATMKCLKNSTSVNR